MVVKIAESDQDIIRGFAVMRELRPHIKTPADFLLRVRSQMTQGYKLAILEEEDGAPVACAGYRVLEMLYSGRMLYVDDLVTLPAERSKGHGDKLMDFLMKQARYEKCAELHLDSGTQRKEAHRFYFRRGMLINAFHFGQSVDKLS